MRIEISVPGTSANLGPGFDALALALDLRSEAVLEMPASNPGVRVIGRDAAILNRSRNLVEEGILHYLMAVGRTVPPYALTVHNRLPVARGLGGSAAALVTGLALGMVATGAAVDRDLILALGTRLEGHGDNVAAALFGGLVVAWEEGRLVRARALPIAATLEAVVFIPKQSSSTKVARAALPESPTRADTVHNIGRVALLVDALREGRGIDLRAAMSDRVHQPYRLPLLPHASLLKVAVAAGAHGAALSGAGSSLLALCDAAGTAAVARAMAAKAIELGVEGETLPLAIDRRGLVVKVAP